MLELLTFTLKKIKTYQNDIIKDQSDMKDSEAVKSKK